MQNIMRLWQIEQTAKSAQEILDALHPWGENNELAFHNKIPILLAILGAGTFVFGGLLKDFFPFSLSFLLSIAYFAIALIIYEPNTPINQVIQQLEQKMKLLKFDLHFDKLPTHLSATFNPILVLSRLKQNFPLFNQGNDSNEIVGFASTIWNDDQSVSHPVLLFKYHYVTELSLPGTDGKNQKVKDIHKDLWGAFVFETSSLGLAASNKRTQFFYPYTQGWQSSDIVLNKKLNIFGYDRHQLAKIVSPSMTLKLINLFENNSGDLVSHYEENMLCFMGERNLFKSTSKTSRDGIKTISELRGYLRTLDMPNYEKFKQDMLEFMS